MTGDDTRRGCARPARRIRRAAAASSPATARRSRATARTPRRASRPGDRPAPQRWCGRGRTRGSARASGSLTARHVVEAVLREPGVGFRFGAAVHERDLRAGRADVVLAPRRHRPSPRGRTCSRTSAGRPPGLAIARPARAAVSRRAGRGPCDGRITTRERHRARARRPLLELARVVVEAADAVRQLLDGHRILVVQPAIRLLVEASSALRTRPGPPRASGAA